MAEPDKVDAWLASDNTLPPAAPAPAPAPAAVELAGYPAPPAAAAGYPGYPPPASAEVPPVPQTMSAAVFGNVGPNQLPYVPGFGAAGGAAGAGCCQPGGGCSHQPVEEVQGEGAAVRLNMAYTPAGCCSLGHGISNKYRTKVPDILSRAGLSQAAWDHWMNHEWERRVMSTRHPICPGCCWCLIVSANVPCMIPSFCRQWKEEIMGWDAALRSFTEDFNRKALAEHGILMKPQSVVHVTHGSKGEKQRHFHRWLAFATTPEEVAKLKSEYTLHGDIEKGCCGGPNEFELMIHP